MNEIINDERSHYIEGTSCNNELYKERIQLDSKKRRFLTPEEISDLNNLIRNRDYEEALDLLLKHYQNGSMIEKYLSDLLVNKIDYKYENKDIINSTDGHLYDISGIIILSYIIHCYICKNDSIGAIQLIKKFERACFGSNLQNIEINKIEDNLDNFIFISWCNSFSLKNLLMESNDINIDSELQKHVLKLLDIFYFFRIQVIFWKISMYKSYQVPNISLFQPNNDKNRNSDESIKIDDYCNFYDQSIDELYILLDEIDAVIAFFKNLDNKIFSDWIFRYKVVLFILIDALILKDFYQESIELIFDSIEKHFSDNISLFSLIARISLQYGNFSLVHQILNKIEGYLEEPKYNTNINIAHYRFTLGLLNMAQDDPVTASLNFNTSAALYKEMAVNLNKEYLLPCCISFNNLSVASFYSSKLPNSISILENQIYNQSSFFSQSQQLFTTNFKNLKTLYQFSSDRERLISELSNISKNSLRYCILIN